MASKTQGQRFINVINQQIDILKGEKKTVLDAVDDAINQVQMEVDTWIKGDLVNQATFANMNNRITQVISLFMVKSDEISGLEIEENEKDLIQTSTATSNDSTSYTKEDVQETTMFRQFSREETLRKSVADTAYVTTTQFATLENVVLSLKKTTEQCQEKQENVHKNMEKLTNNNIKSQKKVQERLSLFEKGRKEMSTNVDVLFETVTNIDVKLNKLEEENKSVNVSMDELNEQTSSVRTCSNDALVSIQDLSKSVESTNQNYNELSHKMNELEISINLTSTQNSEKIENICNVNKDKVNDLFGTVCHMLTKRLTPLEELREQLNKNLNTRKELTKKVDIIESQEETMKNQINVTKSKTDHLARQISDIVVIVDNTNRQVADFGGEVAHMKVETDTMKEQIQNMKTKINTLEGQVCSTESQEGNFESHDDIIESQGDSILNELNGTDNETDGTANEADEMESLLYTISSQVYSVESLVHTMEYQINAMKSQTETLEIQIAAINSQAETMGSHMNMIRRHANTMESEIDTIKSQEYAMERKVDEIKCKEDSMGSDINVLRCQVDSMDSRIKTTKSQVAKICPKVTQIEIKCNRPNVGFFALKTLTLSAGCDDVTMFDVVDDFGSHFDASSGQFTAPLNGFYVISISASCQSNASFSIRCFQKTNEHLRREFDHRYLCAVYENRSITRCIEMTEGEVIYLKCASSETAQNNLIVIQFSCCMIKG